MGAMDHTLANSLDEGEPPQPRFLTLREARALTCNGCGDCCDSRRTDGYWTWGALPEHQYAPIHDGRPLIIPISRTNAGWADRPYEATDAGDLTPTRFRCDAFRPQPDGSGRCGLHERERPEKCLDFPVGGDAMGAELHDHGEVWLATSAFPRCTWYRVCVVRDDDARIAEALTT